MSLRIAPRALNALQIRQALGAAGCPAAGKRVAHRFVDALREPIFGDSRARSELPARSGGVSSRFVATAEALIAPSATLARAPQRPDG